MSIRGFDANAFAQSVNGTLSVAGRNTRDFLNRAGTYITVGQMNQAQAQQQAARVTYNAGLSAMRATGQLAQTKAIGVMPRVRLRNLAIHVGMMEASYTQRNSAKVRGFATLTEIHTEPPHRNLRASARLDLAANSPT